ncbi:possible streptogramin lyase, gluconolactonase family protein [Nitrococcus mobilis Nb-231]|uniref:Possible streptogramin lyase, gluconolactonase family protein n=2 Tax=Nitrococcus mobilis TaxID=35797 RepID=A4BU01_9GAMM|nr:possible streptogramin lyase, gluconolactonase family protein [Nitrococcus mobilis Nb-231]
MLQITQPRGDRLLSVPTKQARPYGIISDPQGRPWVALLGTNKLASVDPETMKLTEIDLPRMDARPRRVARTSDGQIWYVDYAESYLGSYDPNTKKIREWQTPGGRSGPYAMTADDKNRIWFVETIPHPNQLIGFNPATGQFLSQSNIPSGGGSVRHMVFDPQTNTIWFGTDTQRMGRARLPD